MVIAVAYCRRDARDELLGLLDVRQDFLLRLARAGGHPGQRETRRHQLQKIPPALALGPFARAARVFAVQPFVELGRFRDRLQAAPVFLPVPPAEAASLARTAARSNAGRWLAGGATAGG